MPNNKLATKEDVLGEILEIKKVKLDGEFVLTPEIARKPFSYEGTVTRSFCLGCGYPTELSKEGAQKLAENQKLKIPSDWQKYYFETKKCILCATNFKEVSLKEI